MGSFFGRVSVRVDRPLSVRPDCFRTLGIMTKQIWLALRGVGVALVFAAGCAAPSHRSTISLDETAIRSVVQSARASEGFPAGARFVNVTRAEPDKGHPGAPEKASVVAYDRDTRAVHHLVVDVVSGKVESAGRVVGVQPNVLDEEYAIAADLTRADPRWQAALRRRGIEDFKSVLIDGWAPGDGSPPAGVPEGTRLLRTLSYDTSDLKDPINPYSRPIEGVEVLVDLNAPRVLEVHDHDNVPLAPAPAPAPPKPAQPTSQHLRPLETVQPDGPSFRLEGDALAWGNWRLRIELHPREGLILRDIGWADGGRVRPILARAGVSEMVVPYADPSAAWRWRSAFDAGEYGLGLSSRSLTPGREVPENAVVLDAAIVTQGGDPKALPGAVAVYERDGGLGWLHYEYQSGRTESARARELWITNIVTIGNYDYGINWIFREDGSIQLEAMLTGILLPKGSATQTCSACAAVAGGRSGESSGDERFGTLIAPGVVAPNHQHWFNFRLDFDVDGPNNSVLEMNTRAADPPEGNAFTLHETLLRTEREGARDLSLPEQRRWRVVNPSVRNALGHLAGYELVPGGNGVPYASEGSSLLRRAGFIKHHFWVTRNHPGERHAGGDYPNQSRGGGGLPEWAGGDEPIVNTDVVVWYNFAVTHTPRAEEWPVMPVERTGFRLLPMGFFERNPAYHAPFAK